MLILSNCSSKMNAKFFIYLFFLLHFDLCHATKFNLSLPLSSTTPSLNISSITFPSLFNDSDLLSNTSKEFESSEEIDEKQDSGMKCLYYNETLCETDPEGCSERQEICDEDYAIHGDTFCFALWYNSTEHGVKLVYKGCWFGASMNCSNSGYDKVCVAHVPLRKKNLNFCCCQGKYCNQELQSLQEISNVSTESHGKLL